MAFRPVADAMQSTATGYAPSSPVAPMPLGGGVTPPGTGTAIANAASASTPPLGIAPNQGTLGGPTGPLIGAGPGGNIPSSFTTTYAQNVLRNMMNLPPLAKPIIGAATPWGPRGSQGGGGGMGDASGQGAPGDKG